MSIQKFIVSKDDSIYEAWPDVVQTVSGKLICVFSECAHHLDREDARITPYRKHRPWTHMVRKAVSYRKMHKGGVLQLCPHLPHERRQPCDHLRFYPRG